MEFVQKIVSLIDHFRMINPGELVLAAVSGGMDSVTLLHVLWSLQKERSFALRVVHLNHGIRGAAAEADTLLVRELAAALGLPVTVENVDVPAYRAAKGLTLEEAAREIRYRFFEQTARQTGASRVALGHHADDQAETILFNLLRGAGPAGLKGIPPVRGMYIRPMLDVRRREIEAYCRRHQLPFREDASNRETIYTRNRIRLHLIPLLERDYNPRLVEALVRLGHVCREEDAYMEEQAAVLYKTLKRRGNNGGLALDAGELLAAPTPLRRRVLRRAWRDFTGSAADLAFRHVASLLEMLSDPTGGRAVVLPGGVMAVRKRGFLYLYAHGGCPPTIPPYFYPLAVPGATYIPEIDLTVRAALLPCRQAPPPASLPPEEVLLDGGKLAGPLGVRRRRRGDLFWPLGMKEPVRLKKFLAACRVERERRDRLPLVVCGDDIIWVGGVRPAETWKVTSATAQCLHLKLVAGRALH